MVSSRRKFIKKLGTGSLFAFAYTGPLRKISICTAGGEESRSFSSGLNHSKKKNITILIISGWQDINIGDIAHTPGLLNILETFFPGARIILWKRSKGTEAEALIRKNFPRINIIHGSVDAKKEPDNYEVKNAFINADLMIHGSGPSVVGQTNLEAWMKYTKKPFGIFGVTIQQIDSTLKDLLKLASFIFTRETASLDVLRQAGITGSRLGFAPDATFFLNIRDDEKASRFLKNSGLEDKKYICAIPRLRKTPYYLFNPSRYTQDEIKDIERLNNSKKEEDHSKLRDAMISWVRKTGYKVLICPEMTYQVDIMDELLYNPLPGDVKPFVVKRGYWMPDEAASVYKYAHSVISFECHSPIIAATVGTPFMYLRQPEDTIKGQMFYDLGFNDRVFEIEKSSGDQITGRLIETWADYTVSTDKLGSLMNKVNDIYKERTDQIKKIME